MGPCDIYSPRRYDSAEHWTIGSLRLKFITISRRVDAGPAEASDEELAAAQRFAESVLPEIDAMDPHYELGFAILHNGHEGRWLLIDWWVEGGVTAQIMARSTAGSPAHFERYDSRLLACVWEQRAIEHERKAWISNMMIAQPDPEAYLADTIEPGLY